MATLIYPNEFSQNVTAEFELGERPVLIQTKGMSEGQLFYLQYFFYDGDCEGSWEDVIWCCGRFELKYPANQFLYPPFPGLYRLVADWEDERPFDIIEWEDVKVQYAKMDNQISTDSFVVNCCDNNT